MMFSVISERFSNKSLFVKALACAIGVTAIEFCFGVIFNIWLKMDVWDYSEMPLNLLGQICPLYTLLWAVIAISLMPFVEVLNKDYA